MKNFALGILLFLFYNMGWAAVDLKLEPPNVQVGDVFKLTLTLEGQAANHSPNLSGLEHDFTIVGTQRSQSYSFIDGRTETKSQWFILLVPKKTGILTIPALQVGNETTPSRTIEVTSPSVDSKKFDSIRQDLMLLTEASEKKPYLNQQIIYTVKFYNSRQLINVIYHAPEAEDALLIPIGGVSQAYQTVQNGYAYSVEEQKYAVFPQRSGRLKIKPPSLQVFMQDGGAKQVNLKGKPIFLDVKPIPQEYTGKHWLPAKGMSLGEVYDNQTSSIKKGSTLIREIKVQATALPGQLLPKLELATNQNVSAYPEQAIEKSHFQDGDIIGISTTKVTYLFNEEGQSSIPELRLTWFNLKTGKEEVVILPERKIEVIPAAGNTLAPNSNNQQSTALQKSQPNRKDSLSKFHASDVSNTSNTNPSNASQTATSFLHYLTPIFWLNLLGITLIVGLIWIFIVRRKKQFSRTLELAIQSSNMMNPLGVSSIKGTRNPIPKIKSVLNSLQKACHSNNPSETKYSLLQWACLQWPNKSFLSLADIENECLNPELKEQITALQQALYSREPNWEGEQLWLYIKQYQAQKHLPKKKKETNTLPEMHHL